MSARRFAGEVAALAGAGGGALRASSEARARYESTNLALIERHGSDRRAYADGKTATIEALCDAARWGEDETSSRLITCRG